MDETPKEFKIRRMRKVLSCDRCPPHRGENAERVPRKSWKSKRKHQRRK